MQGDVLNLQYTTEKQKAMPLSEFRLIWKVEANDSYRVKRDTSWGEPVLLFTWEGSGVLQLYNNAACDMYHLRAHTVLILDENDLCHYHCDKNSTWKFFFIRFSSMHIVDELQLQPRVLYTTTQTNYAVHLCEKMIAHLIQKTHAHAYLSNSCFYDLLAALAAEQSQEWQNRHPEIDNIITWMHHHFHQKITIHDLVTRANMSRSKFFELFKAMTGASPVHYLLNLKLDGARLMLETTDQSVKTIAETLHFYDAYYFSKQFKKKFGVSPSEYRKGDTVIGAGTGDQPFNMPKG